MPEPTQPKKFLNKRNIIIISAVTVVIIGILIAVFAFKKPADQNTERNSELQPTPTKIADTNTNESNNSSDTTFLPDNTCPDKMDFSSGQAKAILNGKTYFIHGQEGIEWVDKNCKSNNSSSSAPDNTDLNMAWSGGQCTGDQVVRFSESPLAVTDLKYIVPMGRMFDSHVTPTDHQYWQPSNSNAAWLTYSIKAPADGYIVGVGKFLKDSSATLDNAQKGNAEGDDYRVIVEYSCKTYSIFIHLHSINNKFFSQIKFDSNNNSQSGLRLKIAKGEELGKVGGNSYDFTVVDTTQKLTGYVVPKHYTDSEGWRMYVIDPLESFSEPVKSQLAAKSLRSAAPIGGKIDYDVAGTLVGNWFKKGTNAFAGLAGERRYWDGHLTMAYDHVDPTRVILSTGNFNGTSKQYTVKENTPDPKNVTTSTGIVKYELVGFYYDKNGSRWDLNSFTQNLKVKEEPGTPVGTVLFQVLPNNELKVEVFVGKTTSQVSGFTANAQVYER
jgi:hypothetical protein